MGLFVLDMATPKRQSVPFKGKKKVKRLYRAAERDSMVGGVCAGIAEYFEVDPTLIRIGWIVMTMLSFGVGVFGYLIGWIIMPRK